MEKLDTLLYGNGLTIALLGRFKKLSNIETFDNFFNRFLFADKVEKTEFYNILNSNPFSNVYLEEKELPEIENFLKDNLYNITQNGFEVWIGARVFTDDSFFVKNVTCYYLALFNYWYNLNKPMFNSQEFQNIIHDCSQSFKILGIKNTYTLNYDSYLDEALGVKHMHGKFVDNFIDLQQMAYLYYFNDYAKQEFLYPFCAGTNGYEKLCGLNKLKENNKSRYDFEFLFSESINLGKLLIYGIRFADGFIIPEQLKQTYTNQDIRLMKYVDGHLLHRLDVLYLTGRLDSITIAYYEESDKERYERVFDECKVKAIINYEKSNIIF